MSADDRMSPEAISRRLAVVSAAADLRASRRLETKIDVTAAGVSRRFREVSQLNDLCRRLRPIDRNSR